MHRKVAKRARFAPDRSFSFVSPSGERLTFLHVGTPNYLYWLNEYEPETTSLFMTLAKDARVILDIGAADGIYAVLAANANPNARVIAFEPGESAARTCARNVELNLPLTQHVEVVANALGDVDGVATLFVAGESGGTSSLNAAFRRDRQEETVTVRTGDSFLAKRGIDRVDLIKIDTESTEPAVLRGLRGCLHKDHPDVICEVLAGRSETELERVLDGLGYRLFAVSENGLRAREHIVGDPSYRHPNYLFTMRTATELTGLGLSLTS